MCDSFQYDLLMNHQLKLKRIQTNKMENRTMIPESLGRVKVEEEMGSFISQT